MALPRRARRTSCAGLQCDGGAMPRVHGKRPQADSPARPVPTGRESPHYFTRRRRSGSTGLGQPGRWRRWRFATKFPELDDSGVKDSSHGWLGQTNGLGLEKVQLGELIQNRDSFLFLLLPATLFDSGTKGTRMISVKSSSHRLFHARLLRPCNEHSGPSHGLKRKPVCAAHMERTNHGENSEGVEPHDSGDYQDLIPSQVNSIRRSAVFGRLEFGTPSMDTLFLQRIPRLPVVALHRTEVPFVIVA